MVRRLSIVLSAALIIAHSCNAYFTATAYTLAEDECGKPPWHEAYGITASGEYVREGFIAVDTSVIPMHSVVLVYGIGEYDGYYIAKDTGGAIKGKRIDIYMKDKREAVKFGKRNAKVIIVRNGNMEGKEFILSKDRRFILEEDVVCPRRGTQFSAGYDFFLKDSVCVKAHSLEMVHSGVSVEMPCDDVLLMFARSSLSKRGLILMNGVGVIDADYTNEIMFPLYNLTDEDVWLNAGERVVQGVFTKYYTTGDVVTAQRNGGFGSTDRK